MSKRVSSKAGSGSSHVQHTVSLEPLERRQLLSGDPASLRAAGFVPMEWQGQETFVRPGEWVLDLNGIEGAAKGQLGAVNALLGKAGKGLQAVKHLGADGMVQLSAPKALNYEQLRAAVQHLPGFQTLRPVLALWQQATTPNDLHTNLWGLHNVGQTVPSSTSGISDSGITDADIDAPEAWDLTGGETRTVVAGIDSGIDYTHFDLYRNMWINQDEIPSAVRSNLSDVDGDAQITFWDLNDSSNHGAGKITDLNGNGFIDAGDLLNDASGWEDSADGDANGYLNDLVGWDFFNHDNDPMDDQRHGTHTAGTIGATGNNGTGITGVSWRLQMMPLKILGADGSTTDTTAAEAIRYAADNGAHVSNNSYGGTGGAAGDPMDTAIAHAATKNHLFVAAAGNGDWRGRGINNDSKTFSSQFVPASYNQPNIIAVAATDNNDQLASFSNYGATTVDLGAPGVSTYSTVPLSVGSYGVMDGTSMAAPHVAGAAALAFSLQPTAGYATIRDALFGGVDKLGSLDGKVVTGGRLNANNALRALNPAAPATPNNLSAAAASASRITLRWDDVIGETGYTVQRSTDGTFTTAVAQFTIAANTAGFTDVGLAELTTYYYRVRATNASLGNSAWSATASATTPQAKPSAAPTDLVAKAASHTEIGLTWTDNATDELSFRVQRSQDADFTSFVEFSVAANTTSYLDAGLPIGGTYYYRVIAVNASADSSPSNTATATTVAAAPVGTGTGLRGDYYDNMLTESGTDPDAFTLTGWKFARTDATVNFAWGTGSPSSTGKSKMGGDTFTVQWTGMVQPRYNENYIFRFEPDDGVGMWITINGVKQPLWQPTWDRLDGTSGNGTSTEYANTTPHESAPLTLEAGKKYPVEIVYYEYTGGAQAKLRWRGEKAQPDEIIPHTQLYDTVTTLSATAAKPGGTSVTATATATGTAPSSDLFSASPVGAEESKADELRDLLEPTADPLG